MTDIRSYLGVQRSSPYIRGLKHQGERKARLYHTTNRLIRPVYSRGGACPRPGKIAHNFLSPRNGACPALGTQELSKTFPSASTTTPALTHFLHQVQTNPGVDRQSASQHGLSAYAQ